MAWSSFDGGARRDISTAFGDVFVSALVEALGGEEALEREGIPSADSMLARFPRTRGFDPLCMIVADKDSDGQIHVALRPTVGESVGYGVEGGVTEVACLDVDTVTHLSSLEGTELLDELRAMAEEASASRELRTLYASVAASTTRIIGGGSAHEAIEDAMGELERDGRILGDARTIGLPNGSAVTVMVDGTSENPRIGLRASDYAGRSSFAWVDQVELHEWIDRFQATYDAGFSSQALDEPEGVKSVANVGLAMMRPGEDGRVEVFVPLGRVGDSMDSVLNARMRSVFGHDCQGVCIELDEEAVRRLADVLAPIDANVALPQQYETPRDVASALLSDVCLSCEMDRESRVSVRVLDNDDFDSVVRDFAGGDTAIVSPSSVRAVAEGRELNDEERGTAFEHHGRAFSEMSEEVARGARMTSARGRVLNGWAATRYDVSDGVARAVVGGRWEDKSSYEAARAVMATRDHRRSFASTAAKAYLARQGEVLKNARTSVRSRMRVMSDFVSRYGLVGSLGALAGRAVRRFREAYREQSDGVMRDGAFAGWPVDSTGAEPEVTSVSPVDEAEAMAAEEAEIEVDAAEQPVREVEMDDPTIQATDEATIRAQAAAMAAEEAMHEYDETGEDEPDFIVDDYEDDEAVEEEPEVPEDSGVVEPVSVDFDEEDQENDEIVFGTSEDVRDMPDVSVPIFFDPSDDSEREPMEEPIDEGEEAALMHEALMAEEGLADEEDFVGKGNLVDGDVPANRRVPREHGDIGKSEHFSYGLDVEF